MVSRNSQTAVVTGILTEAEYQRMKLVCPHDTNVSLSVWTAFLTKVLGRQMSRGAALDVINEYNNRRRGEQ